MATDKSDPIIVSPNRYDAIAPYCGRIYDNDRLLWGSVFPWEFPQNATQNDEEHFLVKRFGARECHIQGFKFLKQVFYCLALWNFQVRIPAVADAWFSKPDNITSLDDPEMRKWFFRDDVTVKTFFDADAMEMYGTAFLHWVTPTIQQRAKERLEQGGNEKTTEPSDQSQSSAATVQQEQKVNEPPLTEVEAVQNATNAPVEKASASEASTTVAPDQMQPDKYEPVRARVASEEYGVLSEFQHQQRKRGYSGSGRFNNRAGQYQNRPTHPFNDRGMQPQLYSPVVYGPAPVPPYDQPRIPMAGPVDFMPPVPQGQPMPGLPPNGQYTPGMLSDRAMYQPPVSQMGPYAPPHQPVYYSHNHMNEQMDNAQHPANMDGSYNLRGDHRRNSQGSRGGRGRGQYGSRGKGSRGRNSFSSSDQQPLYGHLTYDRRTSNDSQGAAPQQNRRRESAISNENWRFNNARSETQLQDDMQGGTDRKTIDQTNRPYQHESQAREDLPRSELFQGSGKPREEQNMASSNMPDVFTTQHRQHATTPYQQQVPAMSDSDRCTRWQIGPHCEVVNKLVLFDVPIEISTSEVLQTVQRYAPNALNVSRPYGKASSHFNGPASRQVVFVDFPHASDARQLLKNKPESWFDGSLSRVEVPKQFWDTHHTYYFPHSCRGSQYDSAALAGAPSEAHTDHRGSQVSNVHRGSHDASSTSHADDMEPRVPAGLQSAEVAPTASGTTTPKKSNRKGGNKKKAKESRKNSGTLASHQQPQVETSQTQGKATLVPGSPADTSKQEGNEAAVTTATQLSVDTADVDKQRALSAQTEVQTSSEPTFTPTENVKTHLPGADQLEPSVFPQSTSKEQVLPVGDQERPQAEAEPISQSADQVPNESAQHKHTSAEKSAAETEAETKVNSGSPDRNDEKPIAASANKPEKATATPSKSDEEHVDDSFHTANSSHDMEHEAQTRKAAQADEPTMEPSHAVEEKVVKTDAGAMEQSNISITPASPDPCTTPKSNKKVHTPLLSGKPRAPHSEVAARAKPAALDTKQRDISGSSTVPPTPAFVTAPNTPAIATAQEPVQVEESKPSPAMTARKAEKMKGPAQTESYSMFSNKKKQEKKQKPKKGTIRGKPKGDDKDIPETGSGSTSRVTSGTATPLLPSLSRHVQDAAKSKKDDGNGQGPESTPSTPISPKSKPKALPGKESVDGTAPPATEQQETSEKRKGLFGSFSNIFGSNQPPQSSSKESTSEDTSLSKTPRGDSKAPDGAPKEEPKKTADVTDAKEDAVKAKDFPVQKAPKAEVKAADDDAVSTSQPSERKKPEPESGSGEKGEPADIGLGISNATAEQPAEGEAEAKPKKKNKKRSKKKKPKEPAEGDGDTAATESQPAPSKDDLSDASSHTLDHEEADKKAAEDDDDNEPKMPRILPSYMRPKANPRVITAEQPPWQRKKNPIVLPAAPGSGGSAPSKTEEEGKERCVLLLPSFAERSDIDADDCGSDVDVEDKPLLVFVGQLSSVDDAQMREGKGERVVEQLRRLARQALDRMDPEDEGGGADDRL